MVQGQHQARHLPAWFLMRSRREGYLLMIIEGNGEEQKEDEEEEEEGREGKRRQRAIGR